MPVQPGVEADARSDIFAFGAVLYEMLTGRKAFEGRSQPSVVGAIMHVDPPLASTLQPMTPPAIDRVVKLCLAKDPAERWQDAHDLLLQLQWIVEGGSPAGIPAPVVARRRHRERLAWVLSALAGLLVLTLAIPGVRHFQEPDQGELVQFLIQTPPMGNPYSLAVSPNGRTVAFAGRDDESSRPMLFVRPIDSVAAHVLPGTEGAVQIFWSPDSRYIAFTDGQSLKKIEAAGEQFKPYAN